MLMFFTDLLFPDFSSALPVKAEKQMIAKRVMIAVFIHLGLEVSDVGEIKLKFRRQSYLHYIAKNV